MNASGILLINKHVDISSAAICHQLKKRFGFTKIGHTGTLDPFASGVLVVCFNRATRIIPYITPCDKEYLFEIQLGQTTDTLDCTGKCVQEKAIPDITLKDVHQIIPRFLGEVVQIPPIFSALKFQGKPLYKYAREGKTVPIEQKRRTIHIHSLEVTALKLPCIEFKVTCGSGTYVRSLARDIAEALETVGHVKSLQRAKNGPFRINDSTEISHIPETWANNAPWLVSLDQALAFYPTLEIDTLALSRFQNGNPVTLNKSTCISSNLGVDFSIVRVKTPEGALIALGQVVQRFEDKLIVKPIVNQLS